MFRSATVVRIVYLFLVGLLVAGGTPAAQASPVAGSVDAVRQAAAQEVRLPSVEPPTLDPGLAEELASLDVIVQLFDGLVALDASGNPAGVGASSWSISADGLTYTFTLRQGALWSDGRPVTAQDYAWAWKRNVDPETASPTSSFFNAVKNGEAINDGEMDPEQLGVQATDDRTLMVTLERPAAFFLSLLSTAAFFPLRQDVVEGMGARWSEAANMVSNGPFTLQEWQHDTRIVLTRNEQYWGTKPAIGQATFRIFPEAGGDPVLASYEAGEIDTVGADGGIPASQLDRILADPALSQQVRNFKQSGTYFFILNHRKAHLQDARVRMAIGMALNRRELLDSVIRQPGEPARGIQAEGILGRTPSAWPQEDAAAAQQLLADAGYPNGTGFPSITITLTTNPTSRLLAEYTQAQLASVLGITVTLQTMERAAFFEWRHTSEWEQSGDLYYGSWFSDYEDPANWYNNLWDSDTDADNYNGGWANSQFDALVRQALLETDPSRRTALYTQADQVMAQEYPHIPVYHEEVRSLVKPYLKGYVPGRVPAVTPLRAMSVDPH
jgi:oligopeptide transport system substrate-binding protein